MKEFKEIDRNKLSMLIEQLLRVRQEISYVSHTPLTDISKIRKWNMLIDLDKKESFILRQIAEEKGIIGINNN